MKEITSTVTQKGQVTIPREVRQRLGLGTPDRITFVLDDDGVRLKPSTMTLDSLFGSVPALAEQESVDFEDQIEDVMNDRADQIMREMNRR